jgi:glycosyltransferase involved in cell wall biosynthesis
MTIAFFSNFINHHQIYVADELYRLTQGNYTFVELIPMPKWLKSSGYPDLSNRPYVLQAWKDNESMKNAEILAENVDVLIIGTHEALKFEIIRCRKTDKLTLEVSERLLKKGLINIFSPRLIKWLFYYHALFFKKNVYKLCAGAFVPSDLHLLHAFRNKCFKWGYFTKVDDLNLNQILSNRTTDTVTFMWCARFLKWKHPELPIKLAAKLKEHGYKFKIDMYGSGDEFNNIQELVKKLNVNDVVSFLGNLPNNQILEAMRQHHIFLFTSDRNEGWGAIANEAMSNGCIIVCSDEIGSIPFLVKDGDNGCIFKSLDINSLFEKVEWLLNNPEDHERLAKNAYYTLKDVWSPMNAAKNLIKLIEDLQNGKDTSIVDGPCSKANPL